MFSKRKISIICLAVSVVLLADGCKKKIPPPPAPPPPVVAPPEVPPPPAAPKIAQFTAEPTSIQRGESSVPTPWLIAMLETAPDTSHRNTEDSSL